MALRVIEYRQLVQILVIFMIVQFAGILLATQVFSGVVYSQIKSAQVVSSSIDALFYIAYIVIVSVVILLIFKLYKGDKLFIVLEAAVVLGASFVVFLIAISALQGNAFNALFGNTSIYVYAIALALSVMLIVAKYKRPGLRNITAIVASIGVGIVLGTSFSFVVALIFMVILAAYDFIAVFITKHMIALGNLAIDKNLSFLVMVSEVEAIPARLLDSKQRKEFEKEKKEIAKQKQSSIAKKLVGENVVTYNARTALGTGDLAMPLMLAISAYKVHLNFILPIVITLGAILGLIITLFILRKYKRALPAIPPLLFGMAIAMAVYFVIVSL